MVSKAESRRGWDSAGWERGMFHLGHVKVEMPISHPGGNVQLLLLLLAAVELHPTRGDFMYNRRNVAWSWTILMIVGMFDFHHCG